MKYNIKDRSVLRKLLWLDTLLGSTTAILGLSFLSPLTGMLGLTATFILSVSIITLVYSVFACILAAQADVSISLLRTLILANWIWTVVSIGLLVVHFSHAQPLGKIFLLLQIIVVGGLAYFEGKQLVPTTRL